MGKLRLSPDLPLDIWLVWGVSHVFSLSPFLIFFSLFISSLSPSLLTSLTHFLLPPFLLSLHFKGLL